MRIQISIVMAVELPLIDLAHAELKVCALVLVVIDVAALLALCEVLQK